MTNLKHLLRQPLPAPRTSVIIFLLVIALVGFADSSYLAIEHYRGVIPPCSLTEGCERVLTSSFSSFMGIPISLLGVAYYFIVLVGLFAYLEGKNERMLRFSLWFTVFGLLASLWFVYIQVFVLQSYCLYCLVSAATSTILFVTAMELVKNPKSRVSVSKINSGPQ